MTVVVGIERNHDQLADLGLEAEGLAKVLRGCLAGYLSCTGFDARSRPNTEVYFEAVRLLREWLVPLGWGFDDLDHQPRVFHRGRQVALVFASGDCNTGKPFPHPKTRRPKGDATSTKVAENQRQLSLAFEDDPSIAETPESQGFTTYVLMIFIDDEALWAELSLPADMNPSGYIDTWTTRILLTAVPRTPDASLAPDEEEGPSFDVSVARR